MRQPGSPKRLYSLGDRFRAKQLQNTAAERITQVIIHTVLRLSWHEIISIENLVPSGRKSESDEHMEYDQHPLLGALWE